jgi:outer membrane lipoprotein
MKRLLFIPVVLLFSFGCTHVISQNVRSRVDTGVSLHSVFKDPDAYRGRVIIVGGTIVDAVNRNDGTYIEVIEKPLNYRGVPEYSDSSYGRFIILHPGFLDTELFSRGKYITVAGEVIGSRVQKLDEMDYSYLFLKDIEIHLVHPHRRIPVFIGVGVSHSF